MDISLVFDFFRTVFGGAILVTAVIAFLTYKKNIEKDRSEKSKSNYKTNFELLTYFNAHRNHMEAVFELEGVSLQELLSNDQQREAANAICLDFHLLGSLIEGEEDKTTEMFCQMFYYAIPTTRVILNDYINYVRSERNPSYWLGFDQLVVRTVLRHRKPEFIHLDLGQVGRQAEGYSLPLVQKAHNK